ncbi:MAG: Ig-like domain-containing protein, partial [Marinibacterium sp.]|nr:Ig-like domain-containing protein [Marinibacterium sp.]
MSTTDTVTDIDGTRPWTTIEKTISDDGALLRQVTTFDDGRVTDTSFDEEGIRTARRVDYPDGRSVTYSYHPNGEVATASWIDTNDTQNWDTVITTLDDQGVRLSTKTTFDDGRDATKTFYANGQIATASFSDEDDQYDWHTRDLSYDTSGAVTMRNVVLDSAAPTAAFDAAKTIADTAVSVDVLANDSDPDDDALSIASVTDGNNGTVTIDTSGDTDKVIYTPNAGFTGLDTFTYTASDGMGGTTTQSVTITVADDLDLVINEVDADQTGTDSAEFIELYDGGFGNASLDGYVVVLFNGNGDAPYDVIDLDGYSTDENGYFVIGSSNVPNVDLAAFTTNGIQNGADAVAIYKADDFTASGPTTENLVDAIVYDTNDADDTGLLSALGLDTQYNEDGGGSKDTESLSRVPNGS